MPVDWKKLRKRVLRFATEIAPKIPQRGDSPLAVLVKLLSIADSLDNNLAQDSALSSFFSNVSADTKENAQFVDLFYSTELKNTFTIKRLSVSDYVDVVIAEDPTIGTLYFVEYKWSGKPEPSADFWFSPGFNFEVALTRMWDLYKGGLHINLRIEKERVRASYKPLVFTGDPMLGKAKERFDEVLTKHQDYVSRGFPRTYLFIGKQGGGKSTFATRLSQACGKRTLRIDTKGMTSAGATDIGFIISGMKPDFIILDDIDRVADTTMAVPTLLETLSDLKDHHPSVTAILTANSLDPFDPAFLRPGRIDKVIEFDDPDEKERELILRGYMAEFKVPVSNIRQLARATKGLTPAYLREIAIQLRCETVDEVLGTISQMKRLATKSEPKGSPVGKADGLQTAAVPKAG